MPTFVGQKHAPPFTSAETPAEAWAHCPDPRCEGSEQVRVQAIKTVTEASYQALGGEWPFTQNSWETYRVADQADELCGCGRTREVTNQERPVYQALSGFAQDGLLHSKKFNPQVANTEADERQAAEMAQMRKDMAEQAILLTELLAERGSTQEPPKRGPGRPRKNPEEV